MPVDVPVLAEVQVEHLFLTDVHDIKLGLLVLDEVTELDDGCEIHKCTGVACVIITVLQMDTLVTTSHQAFVFEVIDHERAIVHDLGESTGPKDILVGILAYWLLVFLLLFDRPFNVSAVAFGEDHTKNWSPSFASSVEQVINKVSDTPIDPCKITANVW